MRAITVAPGQAGSVRLDERPDVQAGPGELLVEALALGICGTDLEIIDAQHGEAPAGEERLVLGHESLGRVLEAPADCCFAVGDPVVGIVRRPDPVPCPACAGGEWDMCRNGRYTERGIKAQHGYGSERYTLEPAFAIKVDPSLGRLAVLLEPASVLAKAWDHIERIGERARTWKPGKLLVTGAGPVGLLAAMIGRQMGLETHVLNRAVTGPKPQLVADLGATYHHDPKAIAEVAADIVIECTGAVPVIHEVMRRPAPNRVVCLTGLTPGATVVDFDIGGFNHEAVMQNEVIFGIVNANRSHYETAAAALARADPAWLGRLITRWVPLERWREAFESRPDDVKVVLDFSPAGS